MAFFDYNHDGKKDWKDNAREYYLYNKFKEDDEEKYNHRKEEPSNNGKSEVGCGTVFLCFLFMFCMMWLAMTVHSLCK